MSTTTDTGSNLKKVDEFVAIIREHMEASTSNWRAIASAFSEAKEMYGASSDRFAALCRETKFSETKAFKLASIASNERLKTHEKTLAAVHSWTVLYEITTLTDEQFAKLLKDATTINFKTMFETDAPFISHGMVAAVKKQKHEMSPLRAWAVIEIDVDALKTQLFGSDHISTLEEHLRQIEKSLPYLRVARSGIDEKVNAVFMNKLWTAQKTAMRTAFAALIEKKLKRGSKYPWEDSKTYQLRFLPEGKEDLWARFQSDPKSAFEMLDSEYNEAVFWDEAQRIVA